MKNMGNQDFNFGGKVIFGNDVLIKKGRIQGGGLGLKSLGNEYFVDSVNGNDGFSGKYPDKPKKSFTEGYALMSSNQDDVLWVAGRGTAYAQTDLVTMDKNYAHVIGYGAGLRSGGRVRFTNTVTDETAGEFVISGTGCTFENIHWQYGDSATATSVIGVGITGSGRLQFTNCNFEGPINATIGAASYRVVNIATGVQDITWERCSFGERTILATGAAGALVHFAGTNNTNFIFDDCIFVEYNSNVGSAVLCFANNAMPDSGWTLLNDCMFVRCVNANITDPIRFTTGGHGSVILRNCAYGGLGTKVWHTAASKTNVFVCNAAGAATGGVGANPA